MIELLNQYYVPVFTSNEDYRDSGSAPADERAELNRIFQEGYAKKLSVGTVHAYVVGPDGHLMDSLHTAEAAKPAKLIAMLENAVGTLKTAAGTPVVKPCPPAGPVCSVGSIRLYLTARYLERKGDDYALTEDPGGGWAATPGVDWVCVPKTEWASLIPTKSSGASWKLPDDLTHRLLSHFYPPTENNDLGKNHPDGSELMATVLETKHGTATVKIEGKLLMQHDFYHKPDGRYVEGTIVGFAEMDVRTRTVRSFNLVTDRAEYFSEGGKGSLPFGVAVRLAP